MALIGKSLAYDFAHQQLQTCEGVNVPGRLGCQLRKEPQLFPW